MSSSEPPIRVVQCPKCGSPVPGVSAGAIASCSYCGATLQVSAGASGHPIAKLAAIETSTVYLARTEQLKRVREQRAGIVVELDKLDQTLDDYQKSTSNSQSNALKAAGVIGALVGLVVASVSDISFCMGALLAALAVWFVVMGLTTSSVAKVRKSVKDRAIPLRAERDRLAHRIAELEAGLDDLADQL